MIEENVEAFDTQPRRGFSSADVSQLIITAICLASSGYVLNFSSPLAWSYWHYLMFFGNLMWLVFLFLTSIVQFRNKRTRSFVNAVDWVYLFFHVIMFVCANIMYWKGSSSNEAENYWVLTYLIMASPEQLHVTPTKGGYFITYLCKVKAEIYCPLNKVFLLLIPWKSFSPF